MKHNKNRNSYDYDYEDYEDEYLTKKKKDSPRRRPVRDWKRAWSDHMDDYDEYEQFHDK